MKKIRVLILSIILIITLAAAAEPHLSYVYPAGGKCGEAVDILIAGQNLRSPQAVYISDNSAKPFVIEYIPPLRPLKDEDRTMFKKKLAAIQKELRQNGNEPLSPEEAEKLKEKFDSYPKDSKLNHPMLRDLENLNSAELREVAKQAFGGKKPDPQLAESTSVKLNIRDNIKPGIYQIRLMTANGLSNPLNFQIDKIAENNEREPNDKESYLEPAETPVVFNGQIMPGDIDRLSFIAKKGEKLIIETHARSLKPYLADAVPGWFQAVISVLDKEGNEIEFCDDYRFNPDPIIFFEPQEDGIYQVQIHDSIYRGREDFVYRISVAEKPFITSMFPLGTMTNKTIDAQIDGWNLPSQKATINMKGSGRNKTKFLQINNENLFSNKVPYLVEELPDCIEKNGTTIKNPQAVNLPIIINGKIEINGESDFFSFEARKNEKIVIEVNARHLKSPLDAAIELTDSEDKVIAFNDDYKNKAFGLETHHADPYIMTTIPEDGIYKVRIFDVTNASGKEYAYRMRISNPIPTYELRMTPSSIALPPGQTAAVKIDVIKKDGFNEDILLGLRERPKAGYKLRGDKIPAGADSIYVTITAPDNLKTPSELIIESRSRTDEGIISKTVVPAENMMQAFIYYQLVPSSELLAAQKKIKWRMPAFKTDIDQIKLEPGKSKKVTFINYNPGNFTDKEINATLLNENSLIEITAIRKTKNTIDLTFKASNDSVIGDRDNIVVKLDMIIERKNKSGQTRKNTVELNSLPAIPFEIIGSNKEKT